MKSVSDWEADNLDDLLRLLVGKTYGDNPVHKLDEIQLVKYHEAQNIIAHLNLTKQDRTIDLGAGCGFIAKHIAEKVNDITCVDISESFLRYAKKTLHTQTNIKFLKIQPFCFSALPRSDAIYSTAVFIHFNIYDVALALQGCYDSLEYQGRLLFDFFDVRYLDISSERWQRHLELYQRDRNNISTVLHYHSPDFVISTAKAIGFDVNWIKGDLEHKFILLNKS